MPGKDLSFAQICPVTHIPITTNEMHCPRSSLGSINIQQLLMKMLMSAIIFCMEEFNNIPPFHTPFHVVMSFCQIDLEQGKISLGIINRKD